MVNLAGDNLAEGRWTRAKKERILRSRTDAGGAIVEAIRAARTKPRLLVQASAIGIYGAAGDEALDEGSPLGAGFLADVARSGRIRPGPWNPWAFAATVIRSGIVLGKAGGVWPRLVLPFRFFAGGPLGTGRQGFSWISLEDEVRAIRHLVEREDLSGIFNLTAPRPLRQREFCRVVGRALGRPCWLPVPSIALRILFGEKARATLVSGQFVFPGRLAASGFEFRHPDAATAVAALLR